MEQEGKSIVKDRGMASVIVIVVVIINIINYNDVAVGAFFDNDATVLLAWRHRVVFFIVAAVNI